MCVILGRLHLDNILIDLGGLHGGGNSNVKNSVFLPTNAHTKNHSYSFISIDLYPYTCFSPWTIFRGLISLLTP
jgi:hypothetical protein